MHKTKKIFIIAVFFVCISALIFKVWLADKYVVPILMYHEIKSLDHYEPNFVSPKHFDIQMRYLKKHNYNVINIDEFLRFIENNEILPRNTILITFDDGSKNNYTKALPVLSKYGLVATFFVPSDKVGLEGRMSWNDLSEIFLHGSKIGSHTRTEAYLPDVSIESQRDEIITSKIILERNLGKNIKFIAYPIGGFSEGIKDIVKEAGYKAAFATNRGFDRFNKDLFELNRVRMSNRDISNIAMWVKFSGYYNLFRKLKNSY
ncbi:MAG: polysaccharide deacetylase family protein [Candidatus Zapsychrus exili]|nr:polysaccharide deacetylase family protein [Candidatus Zapsychrus exili]